VKSAFNGLTNEKDLKESVAFFEDKNTEKYQLSLSQAMDNVEASIRWLERDVGDIETVRSGKMQGALLVETDTHLSAFKVDDIRRLSGITCPISLLGWFRMDRSR
jgi:hypothetical protein